MWTKKKMSDIAELNPRETIKKGTIAKKVAMDNLQPFCRDIFAYEMKEFFGGVKFRNGDTVMARITPCLENGKTVKVNILDEDEIGFGSTEYIVFRAKNGFDKDYIYYLVCSPFVRESAIKSMVGSSGRQRVQIDVVKNLDIMVPSLKEQIIISRVLKALDDKILVNIQINNNLEQQAMAIFKSWFIEYNIFGGQVPNTWKRGVLGDFVEIKRGSSPRPIQKYLSNNGLHWLKISDATSIASPFINEIKEYIIEEGLNKTIFLKSGSLVLSNSATPGLPKILDIDTCIHDGWLYFPSSQLSNEFLYLYFKHTSDKLVSLGNGSVFTNLKTDILKNYPTYLPTSDILNKFDDIIKPLFLLILTNTREIRQLSEIRNTLLPKLMSGEIDASNLDI